MSPGTASSIKIVCPYCNVERTMTVDDGDNPPTLFCAGCDGWWYPGDWLTEERQRIYKEVGI